MPLSTIFQLYRGGQFYWWRKSEYPEKTTDLSRAPPGTWNFEKLHVELKYFGRKLAEPILKIIRKLH
jgi:hypothetical protein